VLDLLLADLLKGRTSVRGNGDGPAEHKTRQEMVIIPACFF
jgi:hypothetical protein